jgi:hypothetical protein
MPFMSAFLKRLSLINLIKSAWSKAILDGNNAELSGALAKNLFMNWFSKPKKKDRMFGD